MLVLLACYLAISGFEVVLRRVYTPRPLRSVKEVTREAFV
jgi:hypothetical protein